MAQPNDETEPANPVESLIPDVIRYRLTYDKLSDEVSGNQDFKRLLIACLTALRIKAQEITIPADYVKVHITNHEELAQIAVMNGLLIYDIDYIDKDNKQQLKKFVTIDSAKRIAYINISRSS